MGIHLDQLQFDESTPADGQRVGAFLIGSGGTVISETGTALHVNIASTSGMGIYNEDASSPGGELGQLVFGVRRDADTSPVSADGDYHTIIFDDAGRVKVQADIDVKSDVADDDPDTENGLKAASRAIDGLLPAISASGDKADHLSDMYRRIWVNDAPNVGSSYEADTVGLTAAELVSTPSAGRKRILIQNLGTKPIYIGDDASVTTANGIRVGKDAMLELPFGEDLNLFAISGTAGQDVRIMELDKTKIDRFKLAIDNSLRGLKKATFTEMQGLELLALAQAFERLLELKAELDGLEKKPRKKKNAIP